MQALAARPSRTLSTAVETEVQKRSHTEEAMQLPFPENLWPGAQSSLGPLLTLFLEALRAGF